MHRLLLLLSPLLALTGCINCTPVVLTPAEKVWASVYEAGQQVRFRSNRGASNVLTALPRKEFYENQDCNWMESGKNQPLRTIVALTSAVDHGGGDHQSFSLVVYKTSPTRPATLLFDLAGLLGNLSDVPGGPVFKLLPAPLTLASGRRYPGAYAIRNGANAIYLRGSQLRAAYWDPQAGLLRYELASGEVFDLVE
ncbi:MAG TPA: hypothetical protein VF629_21330 [Hymenobacter sp.]|jgi:hypothetical protein|uniref:hypothetical protein n=1 Tax=Hymenobacter sp. TaxID=1898978 RepID=UPI002ED8203A